MHAREDWAGTGDRIPGMSRRSFIWATGSAGLLGGLGALLAACSTSGPSRHRPGPRPSRPGPKSSFPNASTTGPAAGGYTGLIPVSIAATADIHDAGNPAWVQTLGDGRLLIEGREFTWTGSGDPQGFMIDVNTTKKVAFQGCRFLMSGLAAGAMLMFEAASEWHVEYCEFASSGTGHYHCAVSSGTGPGTIEHCNMYEWAEAVHIQSGSAGSVFSNNYLHDPGYISGDHTDGFYLWDGVENITFEHNTIFNHLSQTDCIYRGPNGGGNGTHYRDNLFAGGGYSLYGGAQCGSVVTNFVIENNRFSTRYYPNCGHFDPTAYMPAFGSNGNIWSNNRWYDGPNIGHLVGIPSGG